MEDINVRHSSGWTRLHRAVAQNDIECTKLLLEQKADPFIRTNNKNTAFMLAVSYNSRECVRMLLKYETRETLHWENIWRDAAIGIAIRGGHPDYASWIIDAGGGDAFNNTSPPPWCMSLIQQRRNIKHTLIVFHHLGRKNPYLKKDVTNKIAKMIWETRDREEWLTPQEGPSLKKI